MFKDCIIGFIVSGVAVDISVNGDDIKRKSPIGWRGVIGVIVPFTPVIDRFSGGFVFIEVIPDLLGVISKGSDDSG